MNLKKTVRSYADKSPDDAIVALIEPIDRTRKVMLQSTFDVDIVVGDIGDQVPFRLFGRTPLMNVTIPANASVIAFEDDTIEIFDGDFIEITEIADV